MYLSSSDRQRTIERQTIERRTIERRTIERSHTIWCKRGLGIVGVRPWLRPPAGGAVGNINSGRRNGDILRSPAPRSIWRLSSTFRASWPKTSVVGVWDLRGKSGHVRIASVSTGSTSNWFVTRRYVGKTVTMQTAANGTDRRHGSRHAVAGSLGINTASKEGWAYVERWWLTGSGSGYGGSMVEAVIVKWEVWLTGARVTERRETIWSSEAEHGWIDDRVRGRIGCRCSKDGRRWEWISRLGRCLLRTAAGVSFTGRMDRCCAQVTLSTRDSEMIDSQQWQIDSLPDKYGKLLALGCSMWDIADSDWGETDRGERDWSGRERLIGERETDRRDWLGRNWSERERERERDWSERMIGERDMSVRCWPAPGGGATAAVFSAQVAGCCLATARTAGAGYTTAAWRRAVTGDRWHWQRWR